MTKYRCSRCSTFDEIPTHQAIKLNFYTEKRQELCGNCWEEFRTYFFTECQKAPKKSNYKLKFDGKEHLVTFEQAKDIARFLEGESFRKRKLEDSL